MIPKVQGHNLLPSDSPFGCPRGHLLTSILIARRSRDFGIRSPRQSRQRRSHLVAQRAHRRRLLCLLKRSRYGTLELRFVHVCRPHYRNRPKVRSGRAVVKCRVRRPIPSIQRLMVAGWMIVLYGARRFKVPSATTKIEETESLETAHHARCVAEEPKLVLKIKGRAKPAEQTHREKWWVQQPRTSQGGVHR
jgi:hypothetical protein